MQLSLAIDEFVVFDLETTGLAPWAGDEIVEIGAVKIYGDRIDLENTFHTLVNPNKPIPEQASQINGITDQMVENAPTFDEVCPKFLDFVDGAWLVAQNAKFDMSFLMKYLMQYGIKRDLEVYDTVALSKRCFPAERSHNLDRICERLQLKYDAKDRHRSLEDVRLTALAFVEMRDRLADRCPTRDKWST